MTQMEEKNAASSSELGDTVWMERIQTYKDIKRFSREESYLSRLYPVFARKKTWLTFEPGIHLK